MAGRVSLGCRRRSAVAAAVALASVEMIDGSVARALLREQGTTCVAQSLFILCLLIGIDDVAGLILRRPQNYLVRGIAELRLHCRASRSADGVSNEVEPRLKSN